MAQKGDMGSAGLACDVCVCVCAPYSLASSLVEYVTFTTAVSVSVFTAEMTERENTET